MASDAPRTTFRVLDAMDAPHGGRILRLRLQGGETPTVDDLRGSRIRGVSPDGDERIARVEGFAIFGGRPSDDRIARTGRVDLRVLEEEPEGRPIERAWEVRIPA